MRSTRIALFTLLAAFSAHARGSEPAVALGWFGGLNDGRIFAAGLHLRLPSRPLTRDGRFAFYPEVQVQRWETRHDGGHRQKAWLAGAMGFIRYAPGFCERCFVDGGLGAFAIENRSALDFRPTGSNFTFSEQVGIGMYLDARRSNELRVGYAHFSNGGVREPNPGYDFYQVTVRITF